jgi:hypothetical protein
MQGATVENQLFNQLDRRIVRRIWSRNEVSFREAWARTLIPLN